jgi:hypothetical protein
MHVNHFGHAYFWFKIKLQIYDNLESVLPLYVVNYYKLIEIITLVINLLINVYLLLILLINIAI